MSSGIYYSVTLYYRKEYYITEYYITIDKRLIKVYEKLQHALFYTLY